MTKYLAIGCAVLVLLLVGAGLLLKHAWAENGALDVKLEAANTVIRQREEDQRLNAIAVAQLAQKLTDTETKVITVTEKIYAAPVTRACAESPAMRAASDGVRAILYRGQAGGSAKPPAAVQGPGTGAGKPK